jgi:hypothetical protein
MRVVVFHLSHPSLNWVVGGRLECHHHLSHIP